MSKPTSDRSFTDDVATIYESTLVPLIFKPYADDLAARARALQPTLRARSRMRHGRGHARPRGVLPARARSRQPT